MPSREFLYNFLCLEISWKIPFRQEQNNSLRVILQERERKKTTTAFDVSFRLGWSTNNQSATTASTASEASKRETTQRSRIPFLTADEVTSWNQLSSTDLPRRAYLCGMGLFPRVPSASRNLLYNRLLILYWVQLASLSCRDRISTILPTWSRRTRDCNTVRLAKLEIL